VRTNWRSLAQAAPAPSASDLDWAGASYPFSRLKKHSLRRIFLLHDSAELVFFKSQLASLALKKAQQKGSHATASVA
jgi:hypothetical protein